jgi:hypothetical protein
VAKNKKNINDHEFSPTEWAAVFVMLSIGFTILWILFPALKTKDVAEWTAAIGTAGAFIGTIILATRERARQKADALTLARLTLISMAHSITVIGSITKQNQSRVRLGTFANQPIDYAVICANFQSLPTWTNEEIAKLVPLQNNLADDLTYLLSWISAVIRFSSAIHHQNLPGPVRVDCENEVSKYMEVTNRAVTRILAYCDKHIPQSDAMNRGLDQQITNA